MRTTFQAGVTSPTETLKALSAQSLPTSGPNLVAASARKRLTAPSTTPPNSFVRVGYRPSYRCSLSGERASSSVPKKRLRALLVP
jgi:hypothetical protein